MGACLSYIGLRPDRKESENPETSRLLYEDPYRAQYGSAGQNTQRSINHQPDPETQRREREVMESICHAMTDEVVDVFAIAPPTSNGVGSRVQSKDQLQQNVSTEGKEPSPDERSARAVAYRSVRQSRPYVICCDLGKEESEAARAAMG